MLCHLLIIYCVLLFYPLFPLTRPFLHDFVFCFSLAFKVVTSSFCTWWWKIKFFWNVLCSCLCVPFYALKSFIYLFLNLCLNLFAISWGLIKLIPGTPNLTSYLFLSYFSRKLHVFEVRLFGYFSLTLSEESCSVKFVSDYPV